VFFLCLDKNELCEARTLQGLQLFCNPSVCSHVWRVWSVTHFHTSTCVREMNEPSTRRTAPAGRGHGTQRTKLRSAAVHTLLRFNVDNRVCRCFIGNARILFVVGDPWRVCVCLCACVCACVRVILNLTRLNLISRLGSCQHSNIIIISIICIFIFNCI